MTFRQPTSGYVTTCKQSVYGIWYTKRRRCQASAVGPSAFCNLLVIMDSREQNNVMAEPDDLLKIGSNRRVVDEVYGRLRSAIIMGHFSPGDRFVERSLTARLTVSRTPIREALKRLEQEGLIVCYPHRGCFVRSPSFEEASQAYEMRRVAEGMSGELAAQRATEDDLEAIRKILKQSRTALKVNDREAMLVYNNEFHQLQARAARNVFLESQLRTLSAYVDLLRGRRWTASDRAPSTQVEHEAILRALEKRDSKLARQLNENHVDRAWRIIEKTFNQSIPPNASGEPKSPASAAGDPLSNAEGAVRPSVQLKRSASS
jgi:DNA-binding GntR family transcriptional regulator